MYRKKDRRTAGTARSVMAAVAALTLVSAAHGASGRMLHLLETAPNDAVYDVADEVPLEEVQLQQERLAAARNEPSYAKSLVVTSVGVADKGEGDEAGCAIDPASPAVGADIPETYFGPAPSTVDPSLIGPLQLLTAGDLDARAGTLTLPLYRGEMRGSGENVWYILTDTTDEGNADALGLNFAPKLNYANTLRGARRAVLRKGGLLSFYEGTVDFAPDRSVVPGSDEAPFPPSVAEPGSVGDGRYSPLVRIVNAGNHIYNAPVISFGTTAEQIHFPEGGVDHSLVHDSVIAIDTVAETVTLILAPGFSFARPVLYLSLDASQPDVAALEGATFAPGLRDIAVGQDDSAFSAVERIFVMSNGPMGCDNPQRQGLSSAIADGRRPFNVLGGIPTVATDYSPLWDVNLGEWTQESVDNGYRSRVSEEFQVLGLVEGGFITGPGGTSYGSVGAIVNCPIVFRFL